MERSSRLAPLLRKTLEGRLAQQGQQTLELQAELETLALRDEEGLQVAGVKQELTRHWATAVGGSLEPAAVALLH
ncbi:MAG: hypothetical protein H8E66_24475 [Planctomycetes bacterium]|nr:hypothetical protein [Planctomycetota bacterium]